MWIEELVRSRPAFHRGRARPGGLLAHAPPAATLPPARPPGGAGVVQRIRGAAGTAVEKGTPLVEIGPTS